MAFEENPTQGLKAAWSQLWNSQVSLARFLGADPNELFLRANVTAAFNTFLLGVSLPQGSEILVGEHEYGSILNICRLKSERENLSLRILPMPSSITAFRKLTRASLTESITSQVSARTGLLLLSHVVGGTGLVLPIQEIALALENRLDNRQVVFAVDASYAVGALAIDMSSLGAIDFYGSSLYKYLRGPKGTAFARIHPRVRDRFSLQEAGWNTFDSQSSPCQFGGGDEFATSMMLKGCHDFAPFFAIKDLVAWWENGGPVTIRNQIRDLNRHAVSVIERDLGWPALRSQDDTLNGPMTAFLVPEKLASLDLVGDLWRLHGIQVHEMKIASSKYIVVSPHCDNSEAEIDCLTKTLLLIQARESAGP